VIVKGSEFKSQIYLLKHVNLVIKIKCQKKYAIQKQFSNLLIHRLKEYYTPEQIAGMGKIEGRKCTN